MFFLLTLWKDQFSLFEFDSLDFLLKLLKFKSSWYVWVMTSVRVAFVLISVVVQLCTAKYVIYGQKMTLDNNLSLNQKRCHHQLITQLSGMYQIAPFSKENRRVLMTCFEITWCSYVIGAMTTPHLYYLGVIYKCECWPCYYFSWYRHVAENTTPQRRS